MEPILKFVRQWGAPVAAVIFFVLWCVAEAGRMGPWPGFPTWSGTPALFFTTVAIAVSAWRPAVSLAVSGLFLGGQLLYVFPAMESNHWAIYIGTFIAFGFILWRSKRRMRFIAVGTNFLFAGVMAFMMISWRYGWGFGWFMPIYGGDRWALQQLWWQLFALLLLIAAGCAAVGAALALYEERGSLFRARNLAQASLKETEVELIVEQERTRIARDLHDVLAHSLAVIAAQADGTRYLSKDQPPAVLKALENIASSARSALVDAQRVIEGVRDDGMVTPQPRLSDVGPLVERMRQGNLKIQHSESGDLVELGHGQQLAVFRIVQECLTNALKHGGRGTAVRLHFDWSGPGLTLHAASDVPTSNVPASDVHEKSGAQVPGFEERRLGRGIAGMRERAHLAGGWLTAGHDGEQFRVTVFIPYGPAARATGPQRESAPGQETAPDQGTPALDAPVTTETAPAVDATPRVEVHG
ncbi:sensor histidine kinase [Arthrobacter sp. ISL-30]|uniref:sensor histidine kinase n=1 Tax=Arthrobacter sp. ISL-30 TaxID=2819109 RepID=UPI001BEC00DD|nr:histidine kinase [Arthrobacter sp. ISL-30]MBT2513507.1 two-component sensor histidine kinase [Arthrobacter sp. ISL-30]